MQFGAGQALPRARLGDGAKHGAVATADFEKPARLRKELVRKTDNELVADDKPEMVGFEFGKPVERPRIQSADRIGKVGREHRDPVALRGNAAARSASPAKRPDRLVRANRLDGIAAETAPQRCGHAVHAVRAGRAPADDAKTPSGAPITADNFDVLWIFNLRSGVGFLVNRARGARERASRANWSRRGFRPLPAVAVGQGLASRRASCKAQQRRSTFILVHDLM
jgi:hypothetical protein